VKIQRIGRILVAAAALVPLGACDRSESTENVPVIEEESGSLKLPSSFENLKVLPKDISKSELKRHMKGITKSLGVKCDYCHRTDIRDYATDEIPEKVIARDMMRMLERLDLEVLPYDATVRFVSDPAGPAAASTPKVEQRVLDLARGNVSVRHILDVIPDPDPVILRAITFLDDLGEIVIVPK